MATKTKIELVSARELAQTIDLSPSRISQLVSEGLPKFARGKYDRWECVRWYCAYLHRLFEEKGVNASDPALVAEREQRLRSARADADLKELEFKKRAGTVAELTDVRAVMSDVVLMTKARLLAIPPRLAVDLMGESSRVMIQAKIEKAIKDALTQLADEGSNYNYTPRKN